MFDTVEINNSFYGLPTPETFSKWREAAPAGFRYAVKANRFLTHVKKLSGVAAETADFVDRARNLGGAIEISNDPYEAVKGADAVYTDVWTSMGQEDESEARLAAFTGFQVDGEMMVVAGEQARFLHCLPAHRGEEVAADVIDGPTSLVWQQAANRMHSARALLAELVEGHDQ